MFQATALWLLLVTASCVMASSELLDQPCLRATRVRTRHIRGATFDDTDYKLEVTWALEAHMIRDGPENQVFISYNLLNIFGGTHRKNTF